MKIKVEHIDESEELVRNGNRFFTQEQISEIERA